MRFVEEHLGLPARDATRLCQWYVSTLAASVAYQSESNPPAYFLRLPGGLMLEIYTCERSMPETAVNSLAGFRHLALGVESIESAQAALESRGVVFSEPIRPAGGGGRVLFFADAEGNLLHLVERPKDSQLNRLNLL